MYDPLSTSRLCAIHIQYWQSQYRAKAKLAFARYYHYQYCMAYGMQTGGKGVVYCALDAQ